MFYIIFFGISWVCWFIFADKSRWREIFPVCIFACFLDGIMDTITFHYPLWEYDSSTHPLLPYLDIIGIYVVVTYLFIQWLPKQRTMRNLLGYWFMWTALSIGIELVHVHTGHLHYGLWWNMGLSYLADWILFWIFYQFHKIFKLSKLNENRKKELA